jgi:hypothetical protein
MSRRVRLAVLLIGVLGCAPAISVDHDYDSAADFAAIETYDWLAQPAGGGARPGLARNDLLEARIQRSANAELAAKGFTQDSSAPDVLLACHAGARDRISVTDWGYGYGRFGRWRGGGVSVHRYKEGTLILDVIDARTKELIWRGSAQGTLDPGASPQERDAHIADAVARMLAAFPPTGASTAAD